MPTEVIMPKVDMDMEAGKIVHWHVSEGDRIENGAPLFDIETDKATMEVEAPATGKLHHQAETGVEIPIGQPVAWIYADNETVGEAPRSLVTRDAPSNMPTPAHAVSQPISSHSQNAPEEVRATPLARRLARQAGIDLADVEGSAVRGRIQARDIQALTDATVEPHVKTGHGSLSVRAIGSGTGTPVVLIHGFASDSTGWAPVDSYISNRPTFRIDLPCHGSSPNRAHSDFAEIASAVRSAFDHLDLEQAHLVGHSLGGGLAIALADTRPRKVASLTLLAPAGLGPEINGDAIQGILRATRTASLHPWLRTLVADGSLITEGYARAAMRARDNAEMRGAQSRLADVLFPDGTQTFSLLPALSRISAPTRIIWGRRDTIIPWRHMMQAQGEVALHLFDELGHLPHFEAPDRIGLLLRQYL